MADAQREAWITGIGIVSCLGEGADAHWQGLSERRTNVERRDVRALSRPHARAARFRQADPQEGRPAPDGSVAAHRHLRRRACARRCRREGQSRAARTHGHDRRGRRRGARRGGRRRNPHQPEEGRQSRRLPQRAADERSAPDAVPGAAVQSARRQYLDRPRRDRLLAHLHGRGSGRRRCCADRACAHQCGAERACTGRRLAQRRASRLVAALRRRRTHAARPHTVRSGSAPALPAWRSARSAHSLFWSRAATPKHATPSRWRGSRPSCRSDRAGLPEPSRPRSGGCGRASRRDTHPGTAP